MLRSFVVFLAFLLPLQFAWSSAAAYCQHETAGRQSEHVGHHAHVHKGEAKKASDSKLMADSDCASCHAGAVVAIAARLGERDIEASLRSTEVMSAPPFSSALARAPDRPQWLRLV